MDIIDFVQKGGFLVYILIFLNILGFTLIFSKLFTIYNMKKNQNNIVENIYEECVINEYKKENIEILINKHSSKNEFGLSTIRTIATISPLLGLLGTVLGILLSFDTISKVGLDNPTLFSSSISLALITTVVGLVVSIPHYIFYNYYIGILSKNDLEIYNKLLNKF